MTKLLSKLREVFRKKKDEEEILEGPLEEESILALPRLTERTERLLRSNMRPIDLYPLYQPWAYAHIVEDLKTGKLIYLVEEVLLNEKEAEVFQEIVDYITWELEPPRKTGINTREYIMAYARKALRLFQIKLGRTPGLSWSKIGYYIERDLLGYGILDPIFRDENIEDISCNGPGKPVYVWHRKYESLPTNIVFRTEEELDEYVLKLAHMAGKHISVAYPILDAILPGGHRVAATFQKEVSTAGSTFTVRKFREDPITIIDMINFGTISPEIAAYFWLAMDYKMTSLILGVTGAGKTSTLNSLANLLRPTYKVVTIEDTPELRLPQENWVQLVSRPSYLAGGGIGEITLFHLVKVSLRYRPDVIIVGEVRGEEAYVLFQALATGHSGLTTLHAENIDAAVKRLTSAPMNIPPAYIPLVNMAMVIKRIVVHKDGGRPRPVRRITNVWEIKDYNEYQEVARWDPARDRFDLDLSKSIILDKIGDMTGRSRSELIEEIARRKAILEWLSANMIRSYREVATYVQKYYMDPQKVLKDIGVG